MQVDENHNDMQPADITSLLPRFGLRNRKEQPIQAARPIYTCLKRNKFFADSEEEYFYILTFETYPKLVGKFKL